MANEIGNNVTGTCNQAKMPEGKRHITVTLELDIENDSRRRTPDEWIEVIGCEILGMLTCDIENAITDYEVD